MSNKNKSLLASICSECGNMYEQKYKLEELGHETKELGKVYFKSKIQRCLNCKDYLISLDEYEKLKVYIDDLVSKKLSSFPIVDFISSEETCRLLDIKRNDLKKNQKIKRGYIFSYEIDGKRFFLRKSVEKFKKFGDGRFNLNRVI